MQRVYVAASKILRGRIFWAFTAQGIFAVSREQNKKQKHMQNCAMNKLNEKETTWSDLFSPTGLFLHYF